MRNTGEKIRGKTKRSENNLSYCYFVPPKFNLEMLGVEPGLRSDKTTVNRLAHGADNIDYVFSVPTSQITNCDSITKANI